MNKENQLPADAALHPSVPTVTVGLASCGMAAGAKGSMRLSKQRWQVSGRS
ncbi:hypothetical protein [Desulforamulus profundi]|uniref:hypothetical protein n=1 Tax=Desulforamulus profundi TaxID=1383067 RepID=UPI003083C095